MPRGTRALRAAPGLRLTGLLSHFAEAESLASARNPRQEARFAGCRAADRRRSAAGHLSTSPTAPPPSIARRAGTTSSAWGSRSTASTRSARGAEEGRPPLRPVMSVRARIVQHARGPGRARPSATAGAGAPTRRRSRIAVVPVGYADGYAWRLAGPGRGAGRRPAGAGGRAR